MIYGAFKIYGAVASEVMDKKNIAKVIIAILMCAFGILGIILEEIGAIYLWFQGGCYIGAYYYGDNFRNLVDGVRVEIKDFWGRSQVVTTSNRLVNTTLYFHGWYQVEATYRVSTKTETITTVTARYAYVGAIYVILDKEDDTIRDIEYVKPYPI